MQIITFLKEWWACRGRAFLITRTVLRYNTNSQYYGQPFHLPEGISTKYMDRQFTRQSPRWTCDTKDALPVTFLAGCLILRTLRKHQTQKNIDYGMTPIEDAWFMEAVRGPKPINGNGPDRGAK